MDYAKFVLIACVVGFTAIAAIVDWRTRKLPNALTVTCFATALLYHMTVGVINGGPAGMGWGLLFSLGGFATGFGTLLVLWLIGGGGGGDVKLFGALGAWLGAWMTLKVLIASTVLVVLGGFIALIGVFFSRGYKGVIGKMKMGKAKDKKIRQQQAAEEKAKRRLVPFGVPVALATWIMLAADELIRSSQQIAK